jgi:hypothetical protein
MSEQDKPFVINDRRKFRLDGEPREPLPADTASKEASEPAAGPVAVPAAVKQDAPASGPIPIDSVHTNNAHLVTPVPEPADEGDENEPSSSNQAVDEEMQRELPPPPTAEEIEQVRAAYEQTSERLDIMMRSQNLGAEPVPPMDFTRLVQSIYMSAMMQLGAGTQQGQQARVDLIGAKQSIDMLGIISEKAGSNLSGVETQLIDAALFELRMGFLEITQMLARQAAAKQQPAPTSPTGSGAGFGASGFTGAGPRIVR